MPLTRSRVHVGAAFATQGLVFISLTTRLPDVADRWNLSELGLSGVLLTIVLLAGAGSALAERLAARTESATLLRLGLLLTAVAVPTLTLAPAVGVFYAGIAAYGVALGVIDASSNMQAVALEHQYRRPILPSFHGAWTAGGLAGAALTLATSALPLSAASAVALVPLVVAFGAFLPRDHGPAAVAADPVPVPWRPIVLVGLGLVVFYLVDTAAQAWGAVYLDTVFDAPSGLLALATFPYLLASLVLRFAGDGLVTAYGATRVLRTGALVACAGLALVALAPTWPVAVLGFTVTGAGISVVAPLSFSAAARIAGGSQARIDAVIARFNLFNYVGALLGAVLTGVVGRNSLRWGFVIPTVLVLALVPLARFFATSAEPRGTQPAAEAS